jgi:hypothetical protein
MLRAAGFREVTTRRDFTGAERVVVGRRESQPHGGEVQE